MMKKEILINPSYRQLSDFIDKIPDNFDFLGEIVHSKRNQIRVVKIDGITLVIKYFKSITTANRFIYAHIRKSKAQRAYEYSMLFLSKQVNSPEPVAYMDCLQHGLLCKSFYICLYTDYKPIKEMFALPVTESREGLEAFARFTYKVHKSGIFHQDYNIGNILFKLSDNNYDFSLIDNNRLKYSPYSYTKGVRNLDRLKVPDECLPIIAAEYAKAANADPVKTLNDINLYRSKYLRKVSAKMKLKSLVSRKPNSFL